MLAVTAAPAWAQTGALRGKVVNEDGRPVDAAEIILDFVGDVKHSLKTISDRNGEWVRAGLPLSPGTWTITAKKFDLLGTAEKISIKPGEAVRVPDIVMQTPASRAKGVKPVVPMSSEAAAAAARKQAETDKLLEEANTAITAGNHDEAIAKLTALAERLMADRNDRCAPCHAKIGDIYVLKNDGKAAEAAFLKAIEIDPAMPGPYNALAAIYNEQRRFEEATKMSTKATELMGTAGTTDPNALYNQGVILWNQSKVAEAKAQFQKVVDLDPKMADAHYWLGMANVNQGNLPEAKKAFETYLQLAPKGQYADTAKAILAQIK
jgi:Flp pilus assembly protein TadD